MKKSVKDIKAMKGREKIAVLTCYDYSFAKAMDGNVDIILVGDSLANVVLGYDRTRYATMQDMIRHLSAVRKGAPETFIVCDMPYGSYENEAEAVINAKKLMKAGADAVKPEGRADIIRALADNRINVVGHIGYLPQTQKVKLHKEEGLIDEAKKAEKAGAFSIILEMVDKKLAEDISNSIKIPTIGIGSGKYCDGQVLVLYDLIGLYPDFEPKFARKYMNLKEDARKAAAQYSEDIKKGSFPE
ncbi:3-methyl-2-oxobutanoate hydroxymethyltransferase [Candidatus Woesearchaeota archaeon]|nr:3-methyl-2-oxobutanoate hydroxymethyltransferase [Candidatus Woesearchaeota archaeon]